MDSWCFLKFWKQGYHDTLEKLSSISKKCLPNTEKQWFKALDLTPFSEVRCVILGQDPYPTRGYAMGLAFSVFPHVSPLPASLRNIFTEYHSDLGYPEPRFGDLTPWAKNGVLLWNSILTVEEGHPLSHEGIGWEKLTYEILRSLDETCRVVFVLWGKRAQEYKAAIQNSPVIVSPHPSPYSASSGFFGSRPFSKVNQHLINLGQKPIDWRLP